MFWDWGVLVLDKCWGVCYSTGMENLVIIIILIALFLSVAAGKSFEPEVTSTWTPSRIYKLEMGGGDN